MKMPRNPSAMFLSAMRTALLSRKSCPKLLFFHIIQQYINLFAAIVVAIFIAWKKELVYRDVKQGSNEIKFVKPWVLPPVLYIHNRAWRKVYQLGKIFLCPPFCFPSFFYRYT